MRGTVVGEKVVSQANTDAAREGYDRVFGPDHKPQRGRWVMTPNGLVPADEYVPESRAIDSPIIADRIHEGTVWDDGERIIDIGSRRKRRGFLKEKGWEDATDVSPEWREAQKKSLEREQDRSRHEAFERAARKLYSEGKLR